ncbi:MAG: PBSX family phage terminase large subunit, partial [Candidatus Dadabacteria bacterium]|nr:PBSX family phage terminase large subunit [Candidatus Dadabacteria bacterium]
MNEPEVDKIFAPLFRSNKRYFLLTGGRASLKSTTVHQFIARLTYQKGHGILFTRYTMTSAEKSIIPEFKVILDRLGITQEFHITKNVITNKKTGSFIYFSGIKTSSGDQTANLKSISGITTWIIEEGEDFNDERAFDVIDDSIRTIDKQNRIIWIQNPSTKTHFIYQRWIKPKNKQVKIHGYNVTISDMPNVEHIHSTYRYALKYLDESWIAKKDRWKQLAKESQNPYKSHYYHNYIGGWLEKAEGVIFENWETGSFDESLNFCYGM